jgi:NADPH-dependent 2,4-dienoyl-CoA reductase/sulfur reductase-like enzyme
VEQIVIVGASVAGVHAAESLREHGFQGSVVLASAGTWLPYDRPPLSKEILLGKQNSDDILLRPVSFYEDNNIELRLGNPAAHLDTASQVVGFADGSELPYDGLVVATGSVARKPTQSGDSPKIHLVRTLEDAVALRSELLPGRRVAVLGGGFVALEVASAAAQLGLEVSLIARGEAPLAGLLGREVGDWYANLHQRHGVTLYTGNKVATYHQTSGGIDLTLEDGTTLSADVVVAGIGANPAVDWLEGSGLALNDGVVCSPSLRAHAHDVVAAGDIARWRNPVFGEEMRIEHWTNAADQGRHAARTLLGEDEPFGSVPYFWTDQYDTKLRFVGRATGRTDVRVEHMTDNELVVSIGRAGVLIGAVCVGAPRLLARYKPAIEQHTSWNEAASLAA